MAVVLIPAPFVADAIRACGVRGIRAAMIGSGGFREVGTEGAALEDEVYRVAQQYGIHLIGPNCIGLLDTHLPIDTTFLPPPGPTPGDVAFALAPLTQIEAEAMLESTWAGRKLRGFRNLPPADRGAVLDTLIRLAQLAADFSSTSSTSVPQIKEVEINPLRGLPIGQGVIAVDIRIRIG